MRILLAQINPTVGDLKGNCEKILKRIALAKQKNVDIAVFPELALSGYPPDDLLLLPHFTEAIDHFLEKIVEAANDITVIVGTPKRNPRVQEKLLCNSAAIIKNRTIIGFQDKTLLPTYDVFDERRYFEPALNTFAWEIKGKKIGITICEDIWQYTERVKDTHYHHDPIKDLEKQKPDFVINLSASPFRQHKPQERLAVCSGAAKFLKCPVLLCNQVGGNDSLIFDGYSFYVGSDGELLDHAKGFEEDNLYIDIGQKRDPITLKINDTEDLYKALVLGVKDYFQKLGLTKACLGISGGIDSALVACIAVEALGKENILGIIMPSRFSPEEGISDAQKLIENLGIKSEVIPIEKPFQSFLDLLSPYFEGLPYDTTEENLQARIRGMILMAFSNKFGYIVLSTGNKSEMAMGYATLYGDMCGGLGVINDVPKQQVYELARWINRSQGVIPQNTIKKPPSAELRPGQLDSDSLPDYSIVDNVLNAYVEGHMPPELIAKKYKYPLKVVNDLIKRIHYNEYKRRQSPPGLRVTERAFSIGRRFPIVQKWV
jgi:NAD+ synthase (glutamine-hydrolysing)